MCCERHACAVPHLGLAPLAPPRLAIAARLRSELRLTHRLRAQPLLYTQPLLHATRRAVAAAANAAANAAAAAANAATAGAAAAAAAECLVKAQHGVARPSLLEQRRHEAIVHAEDEVGVATIPGHG